MVCERPPLFRLCFRFFFIFITESKHNTHTGKSAAAVKACITAAAFIFYFKSAADKNRYHPG